ncbi:MAG: ATP-binding protein [Magnetococcus sp. YQC-5]
MSIVSFQFEDRVNNWRLQHTRFDAFNLLVGHSGVGKTKILQALQTVCRAGTQNAKVAPGGVWSLELAIDGHIYQWDASVSEERPLFEQESITLDGNELVFRQPEQGIFRFNNISLPKLKDSESAITLLGSEDVILPLRKKINIFIKSGGIYEYRSDSGFVENPVSFDELQNFKNTPLILRAWILQEQYPDIFKNIQNQFIEIFTTVEKLEINIEPINMFNGLALVLKMQEQGIKKLISTNHLSSGMRHTLSYLFELALAPKGSVFLIDEIENSLGVSCLPHIIDAMRERSNELQFILTSHHPYVINNIPYKNWKLVIRNGNEVKVRDATDIRALQTKSAHDQFILLINTPEYEECIS